MQSAIACAVLLASRAVALTEPPAARPKSGQLDHFSYSVYLDDKTEDPHRLHLPHLGAPQVGGLRKAAKAAPVVAAVLSEIPAVRGRLSEWLGRDVPAASSVANDAAMEVLDFAEREALRLGENVVKTARQAAQAVKRKTRGAVEEAQAVVKEVEKEVSEVEHKAEELIHHAPAPAPRRFHPWLVGTLGFTALLAAVAYRHWAARRRGPAMAGSRRGRRNTPTISAVIPSRDSVLQRTPSQSSLTPVKVHKVEFQRVGVSDGADWDSPDEQEPTPSPQETHRTPSFGKMNSSAEYYQIGAEQDSAIASPRVGHERAWGA